MPVFDPQHLQGVCQRVLDEGQSELDPLFDRLTSALAEAYPGLIDTGPRDWVLNNAGGAMGQMTLLYASLTEYLLLFGTPVGTEGHSGRYRTDVYDIVLDGEMWTYIEGEIHRTVTEPGQMAFLGPGRAKGYRVPDHCWMLEYSRGFVPAMLPFGLADSLTSTLDLRTVGRTFGTYTRHVLRSFAGQGRRTDATPKARTTAS